MYALCTQLRSSGLQRNIRIRWDCSNLRQCCTHKGDDHNSQYHRNHAGVFNRDDTLHHQQDSQIGNNQPPQPSPEAPSWRGGHSPSHCHGEQYPRNYGHMTATNAQSGEELFVESLTHLLDTIVGSILSTLANSRLAAACVISMPRSDKLLTNFSRCCDNLSS